MGVEPADLPTEFARRVWEALAAEKKTPTRTEREAGLPRGYMSQIKAGDIREPRSEYVRALADYLRVSYEWLSIGRGPMRGFGWAPTPLEEALLAAQRWNTRPDAVANVLARHEADAGEIEPLELILEFDVEARRLNRLGIPRPERIEARQKTVERLSARKKRLLQELADLEELVRREQPEAQAPEPDSPATKVKRRRPGASG